MDMSDPETTIDPELTALRDHLSGVIGPEHSETLVGRLPSTSDLATGSDLRALRTDVDGLRTDVNQLRTDVDGLRTDVNDLRTDVNDLRTDVKVGLSNLESRLLKDQRIHVFGVLGANTAIFAMAITYLTFN